MTSVHRNLWIDILEREGLSPLNFRAVVTLQNATRDRLAAYKRPENRTYEHRSLGQNLRFTYCCDPEEGVTAEAIDQFVQRHGPQIDRYYRSNLFRKPDAASNKKPAFF